MKNEMEKLRAYCNGVLADNDTLRREIDRLRAERDEARRLFCKCHVHSEAVGYAESRGWDCFKE